MKRAGRPTLVDRPCARRGSPGQPRHPQEPDGIDMPARVCGSPRSSPGRPPLGVGSKAMCSAGKISDGSFRHLRRLIAIKNELCNLPARSFLALIDHVLDV